MGKHEANFSISDIVQKMDELGQTRLGKAVIGCVAVPCIPSEAEELLPRVFKLWSEDRFFPTLTKPKTKPVLLIVLSSASDALREHIEEAYAKYEKLEEAFSRIEIVSANLTGDMDLYSRNSNSRDGKFGNKAGPNFLFEHTMAFAHQFKGYCLQIEADCLPLRAGWLDECRALVKRHHGAWVIGSTFGGSSGLDRRVQFHLNGNAIYFAGDDHFRKFLHKVWMPRLLSLTEFMPNIAYDCWWAVERERANSMSSNESWNLVQRFDFAFCNDPFVVNLAVSEQLIGEFNRVGHWFSALGRPPIFYHGKAILSALDYLESNPDASLVEAVDRVSQITQTDNEAFILRRSMEFEDHGIYAGEDLLGVPKLFLGEGFHVIEGPLANHQNARGAWTSDPEFEFACTGETTRLVLTFACKTKRKPKLTASADGQEIPLFIEFDPKSMRLIVTIELSPSFSIQRVRMTYDGPMSIEHQTEKKRKLGLLLLEKDIFLQ